MSGWLYPWLIGGFFLLFVVGAGSFTLLLWLGHLAERRETKSTHGFLELPDYLRPQAPPADGENSAPKEPPPSAPQ